MHIHLPKPLHGWREFVGEVGIIVIGVLIALGAEQAIEAFHERELARDAGTAIDAEMDHDLDVITHRLSRQPCIDKRLDKVASLLSQWKRGQAPPAGLTLGDPGDEPLIDQRWQANLNSGRFSEQSSAEQARQADFYTRLRILSDILQREHYAWSQLRTIELGPRLLSSDMRPGLVEALQGARTDAHDFTQIARFQERISGHQPSVKNALPDPVNLGEICGPIDGNAQS